MASVFLYFSYYFFTSAYKISLFFNSGPDLALRWARHLRGGQQVLDVYDCSLGLLRIGPFNYEPLRGVDLWLQQSDDFILQHLSTSPEVEPPHIATQVIGMSCLQLT